MQKQLPEISRQQQNHPFVSAGCRALIPYWTSNCSFWIGCEGIIQWYYRKIYGWSSPELHSGLEYPTASYEQSTGVIQKRKEVAWMNLGIISEMTSSWQWTNGQVSGFAGIARGEETETRRIFSNSCVCVNGILMQGFILCTDLLLTQAKFPDLGNCVFLKAGSAPYHLSPTEKYQI